MEHYYLLGSPISHSLSPAMMNLSFSLLGMNADYSLLETTEQQLPERVRELTAGGASGWNVTMPDKTAMARMCDTLSDAARIAGSVNTVRVTGRGLEGFTTDGTGFMKAAEACGYPLRGEKITLLGSGGAGMAILIQAALDGVKAVSVFCHRPSSADRIRPLISRLSEVSRTDIRVFLLSDTERLRQETGSSAALVNATNVGMKTGDRSGSSCPVPDPSFLRPELFVYDIIYHPAKTPLLSMAEAAGCPCSNGLGMLIRQGAESFRIWTGRDMPLHEVTRLLQGQ